MSAELELHRAGRAAALPEKLEYARFLATSGLLPAQYRDKPGNVLWATEYGETLGITPMAAITGVHVIEGKPSASAALVSALVRRAGHRIRTWGDDEKAVTEIVRSDDPEFTYRSEWTIARARQAELTGKGNWKKYPAAQLKARTVTECARDACQEVLFGLIYTPEELGAEVGEDGVPVITTARPPADATDWASRPATAEERGQGAPEPAITRDWDAEIAAYEQAGNLVALREMWRPSAGLLDVRERLAAAMQRVKAATKPAVPSGDVVDAKVVDDPPAPVREEQHRHMHALWKSGGIEDRDERLAITSVLLGRLDRPVASSKELTAADADTVIAALREVDRGTGALYTACSRWLDEAAAHHEDQQAGQHEAAEAKS